ADPTWRGRNAQPTASAPGLRLSWSATRIADRRGPKLAGADPTLLRRLASVVFERRTSGTRLCEHDGTCQPGRNRNYALRAASRRDAELLATRAGRNGPRGHLRTTLDLFEPAGNARRRVLDRAPANRAGASNTRTLAL